MSKKSPSRWGLLWWFLLVIFGAFLQALTKSRGQWNVLAIYIGCVTAGAVAYIVVKFALVLRNRRLWIENRGEQGLPTYEQPRDAISNNQIVRRILFLPKRMPPRP
jgi:hypothetical protein